MCTKQEWARRIADTTLKAYRQLPRHGKPQSNETTVLAAFLVWSQSTDELQVVSMGTGTKCISAGKRSPALDVVNDGHAEIIARRALLRYLYAHLDLALNLQPSSIFKLEDHLEDEENNPSNLEKGLSERFQLREGITFHLFVSQIPCGDASIIEVEETDLSRTGAKQVQKIDHKSLKSDIVVPLQRDVEQGRQGIGLARRKPGRGEPTLSMSCSDKIAKWNLLGLQGSLLSVLIHEPILLESITLVSNMDIRVSEMERALLASEKAAHRAFVGRSKGSSGAIGGRCDINCHLCVLSMTNLDLGDLGITDTPRRPSKSGVSINWSLMHLHHANPIHEVTLSASGKKAGANKRSRNMTDNPKVVSSLASRELLKSFESILNKVSPTCANSMASWKRDLESKALPFVHYYQTVKCRLGRKYQTHWKHLRGDKGTFFSCWIPK